MRNENKMRNSIRWLTLLLAISFAVVESLTFIGSNASSGDPNSAPANSDAPSGIISFRTELGRLLMPPPPVTTYIVTTTADNLDNNSPTPGSLRAAIRSANLNPGADTIDFSIPGAGPHTINVGAGLPTITDTVTIDGYTQPGASANTLAGGNDAVLKIEIKGDAPSQGTGFVIAANDCVVQGLVIHGFNHAVLIDGARTVAGASENVVRGNFIGTNIAGTAVSADFFNGTGNLGGGVFIDSGGFKPDNTLGTANNNLVGGTAPAARNVIAGNGSFGVRISQNIGAATANRVQGNFIGTNAAGTAALGNGSGIFLASDGNIIGGTAAGARNVISGNNYNSLTSNGISVCCGAENNLVQGNYIGTDVTGAVAVPNAVHGVDINGASTNNNTVGGDRTAARNIISGNLVVGVAIGNTSGNKVQGNYLGTDVTGTAALGNGFNGVYVAGASGAIVGGAVAGEGNVISANLRGGVDIASSNTVVQGNFIGTRADGISPLGNAQFGVRVSGAGNLIGGRTSGASNRIAFTRYDYPYSDNAIGVIVYGSNTNTPVVGNSIHSNEGIGIDLGRNGVTLNDNCDGDSSDGTNNKLQNYPLLTSAASGGGTTTIGGTLDSAPGTTFTLDFYANPVCDSFSFGEGQTYLGSATVTTDGACNATINATLPVVVSAGQVITATATDPAGNTSEFSACMQVTLSNAPPDAVNDTATTNEDTPVTINVLANDTDPDSDPLSVSSFTQGANGSVTSGGGGALIYTPNSNYNGTDSFTYTISDGNGGTDSATVAITINSLVDPPDAVSDAVSTNEDSGVNINVRANDTNGDCSSITVSAVTQGANGSVVINPDGTLRYTPQANFNGADSFRYTISCAQSTAFAFFESGPPEMSLNAFQSNAVAADADEAEVAVNVLPVNDPPNAVDDTATTQENIAVTIDVLANDTDVENNAFIVTGFTQGANGAVTSNPGGTLTYTPNTRFSGTDSFTYQISDGGGGTDSATVTITVNRVSAPPDAVDDAATTDEDANLPINARANDTDGNCGAVNVSGFTQGANGAVALISPNGTFGYFPSAHFHGTDSFTYTLRCSGGDTDTATVTVTVNPVNDVPDARDDSYATDEDTPLTVSAPGLLANDTDADGDALTAALVSGPTSGTLVLNPDGSFNYTPPFNYNGPATFTYGVSDGNGGTDRAVVNITVAPVDDAPVALNDSYSVREEELLSVPAPGVLGNDRDPEGSALTAIVETGPARGSLRLNANGSFSYSPAENFFGVDSFTYRARGGGLDSEVATVNITVTNVNDPPVAVDDSYTTGPNTPLTIAAPGILANDSDVDGDPLTAVRVRQPTRGVLRLNADGSFTYTPDPNFTSGCDSFEYVSGDNIGIFSGVATVTIFVESTAAPLADGASTLSQSGSSALTPDNGSVTADSLFLNASKGPSLSPLVAAGGSSETPTWGRTGNLSSARVLHTATLLRDGKVLVVGGASNSIRDFFTGRSFLRSAELYDPATGTWRRTGDLNTARGNHTASLLPDGRVLVAGGMGDSGVFLNTAEVYDPVIGIWTRTHGSLSIARAVHTAVLLPDAPPSFSGKVLVAGGVGSGLAILNSAELYDPATNSWRRAGNLQTGRWAHTATILDNTKVLVSGGYGFAGSVIQNTAEVYDAATDSWTRTRGNLNAARGHHTATRLRDGKVLLAGGLGPRGILGSAEVYDHTTGTFTATRGRLNTGRWVHTATLLRDGNVLVAGGNSDNNFGLSATNTAELYDPATDSWVKTANLVAGRRSQTAMLLHNNKVLVAGGMHAAATLNKAELYDTLDTRKLFSTCAGVTVTALYGEGFIGNSRIARIENGKVPCMNSETGETAECVFATNGVSAGLMWVEAVDGEYAKTGQAITPQGEPGGEWIVAARVNPDGTVPCVAPSGHDTLGVWADGRELAANCVREDVGVSYNAYTMWSPSYFFRVMNYTDGNVCSLDEEHPDQAALTKTINYCNGTIYCYSFWGAALNDLNGAERDDKGLYFAEPERCHIIQNGGFEVPAAKRPATRSFPAPGSVNVYSLILWRPVSPNVTIANSR